MNLKEDKIIGIVGGMGPQAGIDLFTHISRLTQATKDQDHKSVILMSFPRHIVDRTSFIERRENINPAYPIAQIISQLEKSGADVVGLACNSSYVPKIYDVIMEQLDKSGSKVRLLHMPFETCHYIKKQYVNVRRVGIMATNGTYKSGIYQKMLKKMGFDVITPALKFQKDIIHRIIYDPEHGIKACAGSITNKANFLMQEALHYFEKQEAEAVILGCTELSLMLDECNTRDMLFINSNEALAHALIRESDRTSGIETYTNHLEIIK